MIEITAYMCPCDCSPLSGISVDQQTGEARIEIEGGQVVAKMSSKPALSSTAYVRASMTPTETGCGRTDQGAMVGWTRTKRDEVQISYNFPGDCDGATVMPQQPPYWGTMPPELPRWEWKQWAINGAIIEPGGSEQPPSPDREAATLDLEYLQLAPGCFVAGIDTYWHCPADAHQNAISAAYFATRTLAGGYITDILGDRCYLVSVRGNKQLAVAADFQSYTTNQWVFLAPLCCSLPDSDCAVKSQDYNLGISNGQGDLLDTGPFVIVPIEIDGVRFCDAPIWTYAGSNGTWDGLLDAYVLKTTITNINHDGCPSYPSDFGSALGFASVPIKYKREGASNFTGGSCVIPNGEKAMIFVAKGVLSPANMVIFGPCRTCPQPDTVQFSGASSITYGFSATYTSIDRKVYGWRLIGAGSISTTYGNSTVLTAPLAGPNGQVVTIEMFCPWDPTITIYRKQITYLCPVASIVYSTLNQPVGSQQTLSSSDGKAYYWDITGGGTLSTTYGSSTVLTAPASNPNCNLRATVTMLDIIGCINQTIKISFDGYPYDSDNGAYMLCSSAQCYYGHSCWWASATYTCKNIHLPNKDNPSYYLCGYYPPSNCTAGVCTACTNLSGKTCAQFVADLRTQQMKDLGCCPGILA